MKNFSFYNICKILLILYTLLSATGIHAAFKIINNGEPAPIWYSGEGRVVKTAIEMYSHDVLLITGKTLGLHKVYEQPCIIVGTIGIDTEFEDFISKSTINLNEIKEEWEAFHIEQTNIEGTQYLIVAGSDLRGTAYGVLELSRLIGVSPWIWWADVQPVKRKNIAFEDSHIIEQKPSVQYRGIFINDEDWGLNPWSYKNFELSSKKGNIGPRTYEKVFELLLRLRANTIWPAMHECTIPFFFVQGNKEMADKYGIVIGTSHCEPMMRNSAGEWNRQTMGAYNYKTNKHKIQKYWAQRLDDIKKTECIFTIGLRGVHDGRMEGVKSLEEETHILSQVISDQRHMISNHFKCTPDRIPQIFVPYKEVLKVYNNGLKLPEDISLIWCDDNHGYITRLSNYQEQERKGGAGVYYHISYWGKPHDYLWLGSTQPGLIYKEMKRAWDYNARRLWILNVGDIKPGEYLTSFFLDMAWNINIVTSSNIYAHQKEWYSSLFGDSIGYEVDKIMRTYYRLSAERKPEHMGWSYVENSSPNAVRGLTPVVDTEFNPFAFGDEVANRISEYQDMVTCVKQLRKTIPTERINPFFELVEYPIYAASAMNEKLLYAQMARTYAHYNLPVAQEYATLSEAAYNKLTSLTHYYNRILLNGKWDEMIDISPRNLPVFQKPQIQHFNTQISDDIKVQIPNSLSLCNSDDIIKLDIVESHRNKTKISFFDQSHKRLSWHIINCPSGISIIEEPNGLLHRTDLNVLVKDSTLYSSNRHDNVVLKIGNKTITFRLCYKPVKSEFFNEINGYLSFNASECSVAVPSIQYYEGLGHSGKSVYIQPTQRIKSTSLCLKYDFYTETIGEAIIKIGTIPVHPANNGDVRIGVSIDKNPPQIFSLKSEFLSNKWSENVLRNQVLTNFVHKFKKTGKHTIRLYALDNDICFDQIMIDFNKERKGYLLNHINYYKP